MTEEKKTYEIPLPEQLLTMPDERDFADVLHDSAREVRKYIDNLKDSAEISEPVQPTQQPPEEEAPSKPTITQPTKKEESTPKIKLRRRQFVKVSGAASLSSTRKEPVKDGQHNFWKRKVAGLKIKNV